jgi:hypothetical protein
MNLKTNIVSDVDIFLSEYQNNLEFVQRQKNKKIIENFTMNEDYLEENLNEDENCENDNENLNKDENCEKDNENYLNEDQKNQKVFDDANIEDIFLPHNYEENMKENIEEQTILEEEVEKEEEIEIKIKKTFLIQIIFYLFLKLNISKTAFSNLIIVFNYLFKIKLNYKYFENKIKKKIKIENKKIIIDGGYYIYNSIKKQILNLLNYENTFEIILKNIKKIKENNNEDYLKDITDGKNYKKPWLNIGEKKLDNGTILEEIHLNLILCMDGFKFFFSINYLIKNRNFTIQCFKSKLSLYSGRNY